ncbi:OLC1v1036344C7 [Oldenlandia corymbosa var. corymbosa]|uniref:Putative gamma-glutamylcyclotransferase n=1 Tax=Oldenlandia corymbosa var. corymbosa TaxID=529605 RepID=A0AAV1CYK7_OLDCO|nr:OLC1v1036344C7 [Oldenlandia corymbosa var. corymbosa]
MGSSIPQAAMHNVFVYGSLLADDVVRVLLHRVPRSSPAVLRDFHRFSIKGRVYPAILPIEAKEVVGKVLLDITPFELEILDYFEDDEYERKTVDVYLMESCGVMPKGPKSDSKDTSEKMQVDTYVWCNKSDPNLYGEWDFEEWKRLHKEDFIKMSMGFMEELQLPESKPRVATYESFYQQKDDRTSMA